ncbi:MAG: hypothetical protein IIW34_07000 [Clostridia bacterium]|nr:hypothetical protein [Clostridia bacterium]
MARLVKNKKAVIVYGCVAFTAGIYTLVFRLFLYEYASVHFKLWPMLLYSLAKTVLWFSAFVVIGKLLKVTVFKGTGYKYIFDSAMVLYILMAAVHFLGLSGESLSSVLMFCENNPWVFALFGLGRAVSADQ